MGEGAQLLMPISFQGPNSEGSLTTAAAATEVSLSTFEDEEASGVPTDGLAPLTATMTPEQAVTSVSVIWHPLAYRGETGLHCETTAVLGLGRGTCSLVMSIWVGSGWREAGRNAGVWQGPQPCSLLALPKNLLRDKWSTVGTEA